MSRFKGIVYLSQAQYDGLATKDQDILYCINDKNVPIPYEGDSGKIVKVDDDGQYVLALPTPAVEVVLVESEFGTLTVEEFTKLRNNDSNLLVVKRTRVEHDLECFRYTRTYDNYVYYTSVNIETNGECVTDIITIDSYTKEYTFKRQGQERSCYGEFIKTSNENLTSSAAMCLLYGGTHWSLINSQVIGSETIREWHRDDLDSATFDIKSLDNDNEIQLVKTGSFTSNLKYIRSANENATWTPWDGSPIILNANEVLRLASDSTELNHEDDYCSFVSTGRVEISGDIYALIKDAPVHTFCFAHLFSPYSPDTSTPDTRYLKIVDASGITIEGTAVCSYFRMFIHCKDMTSGPVVNIAEAKDYCCEAMFQECSSLVNCPLTTINDVKMYSYRNMFVDCTGITDVPTFNPSITTLKWGGLDGMFTGCTSLSKAIDLSHVTEFENYSCRSLYNGCTSLTIAENGTHDHAAINLDISGDLPGDAVTDMFKNVNPSGFMGTPTKPNKYYYE